MLEFFVNFVGDLLEKVNIVQYLILRAFVRTLIMLAVIIFVLFIMHGIMFALIAIVSRSLAIILGTILPLIVYFYRTDKQK